MTEHAALTSPAADETSRELPVQRLRAILTPAARQAGLATVIVVLLAVFGFARPLFVSGSNLLNILLQAAVVGILAIGQTFVLLTGGIDLSIGSTVALSAVCAGLATAIMPTPLAIACGILVGAAAGLLNGLLITTTRITPFIITLGTMSIFGGLALISSGGQTVYKIPTSFQNILAGRVATVPIPVVVLVVLCAIGTLIVRRTRFGEYLIAIGGNAEVARLAGINVRRYTTQAYVVSGACAGLAATLLVARLGAADPTLGADLLLTAIAATVMGGTSLMGGEGSVVGAVFGAILIATLTAGLTTLNVQAFYQQVAVGVAIILALLIDQLAKRRR